MYSTSDKYKELIYSGKKCLLNIYIDGILIDSDDIYSFKVCHNLFDGGKVSLGSTTSKSIELEINREALPKTYSNFYVETGLTIDGVDEIFPIGYFTLEEINKDEDVVSITAVDYMMKFEKIISDFVSSKAIDILQAICDTCGVELATTDFVGSDTELIIYDGTTMTARQVIGYIAELAGGFAIVDRDGKLYIKKIGENTSTIDIDLFGDYSFGEEFICNGVEFITENYNFKESNEEIAGQLLSLNVNNPFITTQEQVQAIYNKVIELKINGFNGQSLLDPALDIGDIIYIDDKPVVFQGDMEYLGYFKGNISSTIETEEKNKTTVQSISLASKLKQVSDKVIEVEESIESVENKVDSDKIISSINKSEEEIQIQAEKVSLTGKTIDLTGDNIKIQSNNFLVDEEGNLDCNNASMKNAIITGGNIELQDDMTGSDPQLIINGGDPSSSYGSALLGSYELQNVHYEYEEDEGVGYTTTNEGAVRGSNLYVSSRCTGYNNNSGDYYDLGENSVFIKTNKTNNKDEASISIEHDGAEVFSVDISGVIKSTNKNNFGGIQKIRTVNGADYKAFFGVGSISDKGTIALELQSGTGEILNRLDITPDKTYWGRGTGSLYSPNANGIYFDQYGNIYTKQTLTSGNWRMQNGSYVPLKVEFSDNSLRTRSVYPEATNTHNLGSDNYYWKNVYSQSIVSSLNVMIPKGSGTNQGLTNTDGSPIIQDYNNKNVVVNATGGTLYLGYANTTGLNFLSGKVTIASNGNIHTDKDITCGSKTTNDGSATKGIYIGEYGAIQIARSGGDPYVGLYDVSNSSSVSWSKLSGTNPCSNMTGYFNINYSTNQSDYRLYVNGNSYLSGSVNVGSWLVVNGTLRPNSNNSFTLGNSSNYWSNGYITKLYFNELVEKDMNVAVVSGDSTNSYFGTGGGSSGKTTNLRGSTVRLYAHSGGGVYLGSSGSTAITSDENLKDIYEIDEKYIDFFNNLKPVNYIYKQKGHRKHFGFGARQVEQSLLDAGLTTEDFAGVLKDKDVTICADENGTGKDIHYDELYSLRYEEFIALNTLMIQKQNKEIGILKDEIKSLKKFLKERGVIDG